MTWLWIAINAVWTIALLIGHIHVKRFAKLNVTEAKVYDDSARKVYEKAIIKLAESVKTMEAAVLAREEQLQSVETLLMREGYTEAANTVKRNHLTLLKGGKENSDG